MFAIRRVRDHLDLRYGEPLTLQTLATLSGMSRFHLIRQFRAAYGVTPIHYLSHRRIAKAQDLLRYANLTVTEVCVLVGFSSLGSFSSRFRALVGVSPSDYQRRYAHDTPHIPGCHLFMYGVIRQSGRSAGPAAGPSVEA
ncbi:helix-turn-helix domain-containing protein [Actinoplanes sp. CA-030573]|uniref:helix-turn-helix domain-containing protein n=1 Tax=Actinoplanes sp. CA-030573 TaxID=3239898 RepID=UPI003D945DC1